MNKFFIFVYSFFFVFSLNSQTKKTDSISNQFFDEKLAFEQAIAKGIKSSEINGYVQFLKNDFSSKKAFTQQAHKHSPYENSEDVLEKIIYLNPQKTNSAACSNMGFEQYNFNGWTGEIGQVTTGSAGSGPSFTTIGNGIYNSGGNNSSLINSLNFHTIMTLPPINSNYLSINGYDSIACKAIGSQTVSEIPLVSPFSIDPVSVRLNSANANYRACRLKYITTTSSSNQQISFSYAVVIQNPNGHSIDESPYFKITLKNEITGLPIPGCSNFLFNPQSTSPSDSLKKSVIGNSIDTTIYRKWQYYSVDLSTLPLGTSVSLNFEVGGCSLGGHWGYAYVDAECGSSNIAHVNMCPNSPFATLIAPKGFSAYQWFDSSGLILGAVNDTLIENNPVIGATYTVNMVNPSGCLTAQTITINTTSVTISHINTSNSCPNGNTGTATVYVIGSNSSYTYTWTVTSGPNYGSIISNSPSVTGLAPGTYSVLVSSVNCGIASGSVTIGVEQPQYSTKITKSFCGNSTKIEVPGGTNYFWYQNFNPIPSPVGTNDTLFASNIISGEKYTVVYINSHGCKDSVEYTLNKVTGGDVTISNIKNICPNNTNGSGVVLLNPAFSSPYQFILQNTSGIISNTTSSLTTFSITNLSVGTYTTIITDGNCIYSNTFNINSIQTNFTITPSISNSCSPADTARINFYFGTSSPSSCSSSAAGLCVSPDVILIGNDTLTNSTTSYPSIYSNWYKNARHQILYRASELIASGLQPGRISSMSFNIKMISGATVYPSFTIKMKCTSENDLTSSTFDNIGLTQVYYSQSQNITPGWNYYPFSNMYDWDGVSNILIDICSDFTPNFSTNSPTFYSITPYESVRWFNSDATPACMTTNVASSYSPNNTYRPNIIFESCGSASPSSYTISVSSNGNIVQNYNNDSIKIIPVTTPTADIVYTITVTNPEGGCTSSQTFTMSSSLSAYTTYTNASCGSCADGSAQVNVNCGTGPYSYLWSPGGQTTQLASGLLPGCYTVTVTDASLNSTTNQVCISFVTKLEESSTLNGLSIFPNPSNGIFNIYSESNIESLNVSIINTLGQNIFSETQKNTSHMQIDLSKMSRGVYYLKAHTNSGTKLFKLIIE
ncbi:MAG TPA: T9SS type A sorting domain-containing protein [Bacteroidia bacterium]|nr:T9SS type A sorting domain-containing protein [Bacteroidia bacterium]